MVSHTPGYQEWGLQRSHTAFSMHFLKSDLYFCSKHGGQEKSPSPSSLQGVWNTGGPYGCWVRSKCSCESSPLALTIFPLHFSRQEYWMGCHSVVQGIFLTQGSNPGLAFQADFLPSEPPGKPLSSRIYYLKNLCSVGLLEVLFHGCFHLNFTLNEVEYIFPYNFSYSCFFFCELSGNLTFWVSFKNP